MIVIDTLRWDHLGCYGYARPTSPFIDELARNGVMFRRAHATAPWTVPSTASLLTGLYPSEHGAEVTGEIRRLNDFPPQKLGEQVISAVQVLQKAGLATGLFSANPYLFGRFKLGFDVTKVGRRPANELTDLALEFLEAAAGGRFFVHLQYMDPHPPIEVPTSYFEFFPLPEAGPRGDQHKEWRFSRAEGLDTDEFLRFRVHKIALYDGSIRYVDSEVERLVHGLERLGLDDTTLVVITSDHGEEFWDHAKVEAELGGDPRGYYGIGHGHSMFQELLRVPLIFYGRGVSKGLDVELPVSLVDIAPTLLDLLEVPSAGEMSGFSLRPLLTSGVRATNRHRPIYAESPAYGPSTSSLIDWPWKLIRRSDGSVMLFDLDADPDESENLASSSRDRLNEGIRKLEVFRSRLVPSRPSDEMDISPELKEQLRSLGYLE